MLLQITKRLVVAALLLSMMSCMSMRVVAKYDSNNPVPHKETRWAYFWGLKQPVDIRTDPLLCESICSVTTKANIGTILVSAVTLGIAVPMKVEYTCCPDVPDPGNLKP
ncbi:MAG: hypothetical protein R3301_17005 [Saprospiraceae bacterium]|nr:hypothetical protein [Saprospiraceae bacterium]